MLMLCPSNEAYSQRLHAARQLNIENGLADNRITALAQDSSGYIWIGTPHGLCRFDGFSIETFTPSAIASISNEVINDIETDKHGNIWIATFRGLNRYDTKKNTWQRIVPPETPKAPGFPNPLIWDLYVDPDGTVWIANDGAYFIRYAPQTQDFSYFDFRGFIGRHKAFAEKPGYYAIKKCLRKNDDEFWLAFNKGLALLNIKTGEFSLLGAGFDDDIMDMVWDTDRHKIWLSVSGGQLFSYNTTTGIFEKEAFNKHPENTIVPAISTDEKSLSIASDKGLISLGNKQEQPSIVPIAYAEQNSLLNISVSCRLTTKDGTIFTGTNRGLWYFNPQEASATYLRLFTPAKELGGNTMTSVLRIDSLNITLATCGEPAALYVLSSQDGQIKKITRDEHGKPLAGCMMVKKMGGIIWLLTTQQVYQFLPGQNILKPWLPSASLNGSYYRDIEIDDSGNVWLASFITGVWRYNPNIRQWDQPTIKINGQIKRPGTSLLFDPINRWMWVGYFGYGLQRYKLSNNEWDNFIVDKRPGEGDAMTLLNEMVNADDGSWWITTHTGGLFRGSIVQGDSLTWRRHYMGTGGLKNQYLSVAPAGDGAIFALHSAGISTINTNSKEVAIAQPYIGMQFGSDPVWPHRMHHNYATKELLVPAPGGMLQLNTQPVIPASFPLGLASLQTDDTLLNLATQVDPGYRLSYRNNSYQFTISALYFGTTPMVFEYKLAGPQDKWIPITTMPQLNLQQLVPGNYRLLIKASLQDGTVIAASAPFELIVWPPFWKTTWFFLLVATALVAVVLFVFRNLKQKILDEKLLNRFAIHLYTNNSLKEILSRATAVVQPLLGCESCSIYEFIPEKNQVVLRSTAGDAITTQSPEIPLNQQQQLSFKIAQKVVESKMPVSVRDTRKSTWGKDDTAQVLSLLAVPIWIEGKIFGVVVSESSRRNFFTHRQVKQVEKMTTLLGERISKFITEDKIRDKLARDLHDEIGSTLTGINILSKVANTDGSLLPKTSEYLYKIQLRSADMMEKMSDIIWAVNPANDTLDQVVLKMKEWMAEMLEPMGIHFTFNTEGEILSYRMNPEMRRDWYLIFKEAITNAVKYSKCSSLEVSISFEAPLLTMQISDNGIGFDQQQVSAGNGLKNMRKRAALIQAELLIESKPGSGTLVKLVKNIT